MENNANESVYLHEIPVDFESSWYQSVLERDDFQSELFESEVPLGPSMAHIEVREVQYLLGRHLRTKQVRIITNRPVPSPPVKYECELCFELTDDIRSQWSFLVCGECEESLIQHDDRAAGLLD